MGWGRGQRLYHDAIIGYTDGKSQHIEPTLPADNLYGPGGRYRPQEVKGNMGKFGQLVYNLTGSGGSNVDPGMRCQIWAMTEPVPTLWTEDLFTCPCTLSQALEDLSFMQDTTDPGSRVKTLRGQRWGGTGGHVFKSVLSNSHGSGKRCAYEPDGPLLAGYSERYFLEHNMQKHIGTCPLSNTFARAWLLFLLSGFQNDDKNKIEGILFRYVSVALEPKKGAKTIIY